MDFNTPLLKKKAILIADRDEESIGQICSILERGQYSHLILANNEGELRKNLEACFEEPQDIGVLIINEKLLEPGLLDWCSASLRRHDINVPVILLAENESNNRIAARASINSISNNVVHRFVKPLKSDEFLPLLSCALLLKRERDLRCEDKFRQKGELHKYKALETRLKKIISFDELTGLPNRRSLEQRLNLMIQRSKSIDIEGALLYVDIDNFNVINHLEGYDAGDRLLSEVVQEMRGELTRGEYIARLGSDEFCVFLENYSEVKVVDIADRLRKCFEDYRFISGDVSHRISASIGIAFFHPTARIDHPNEFISRAHQACYVAKQNGRNLVWIYNQGDSILQSRKQDLHWMPIIREALSERRVFLVFQPVIRVRDGLITHYEALLRIKGDNEQVFLPGEFIPIAERTGLMKHIDLWVVENAIDFLAALPEHQSHISLTVNLSGMALLDRALLPLVKQKLEMTWLDPARLTFEITETAVVENWGQARNLIDNIRALGCSFSLDDFGAGFCSFNYIKQFPVDYLKIDGQFIKNMLHSETDRVLVKAMIKIGRELGKYTVAEYVENPEVLKMLREMGVDYVQGYLTGRPAKELNKEGAVNISELIGRDNDTHITIEHSSRESLSQPHPQNASGIGSSAESIIDKQQLEEIHPKVRRIV